MKKLFCCLAAMLPFAGGIWAQGFYLKLGAGYALPTTGQTMNTGNNMPLNGNILYNAAGTIQSYDIGIASMLAGIQGTVGAGFLFDEHVGVELNTLIGISTKKYSGKSL